jgi:hypothetical protein
MNTDPSVSGADAGSAAAPPARVDCLCLGLGPQLTALLRSLIPPGAVLEQIRTGQLEALKFLRMLIDQRIASLTKEAPQPRGTRVRID